MLRANAAPDAAAMKREVPELLSVLVLVDGDATEGVTAGRTRVNDQGVAGLARRGVSIGSGDRTRTL